MSKLSKLIPGVRIEHSGRSDKNPVVIYKGRVMDLGKTKYDPYKFAAALIRARNTQSDARVTETVAQRKKRMRDRLERAESSLERAGELPMGCQVSTRVPKRDEHFRNWLKNGNGF